MSEINLQDEIHGIFYDLLKGAGVTINSQQVEKVRIQSSKLARVITNNSKLEALKQVSAFQTLIVRALDGIEKDIKELKDKG